MRAALNAKFRGNESREIVLFFVRLNHLADLRGRRGHPLRILLFAFAWKSSDWSRYSDGGQHRSVTIANRRRKAADSFQELRFIRSKSARPDLLTSFGQHPNADDRIFCIRFQRFIAQERLEALLIKVRDECFAVGRAIQRYQFSGLSCDRDYVTAGLMIDEEGSSSLANRKVRGLVRGGGERFQ